VKDGASMAAEPEESVAVCSGRCLPSNGSLSRAVSVSGLGLSRRINTVSSVRLSLWGPTGGLPGSLSLMEQ